MSFGLMVAIAAAVTAFYVLMRQEREKGRSSPMQYAAPQQKPGREGFGRFGTAAEVQSTDQAENTARCPYCGSTSLSVSRRGYRLGWGLFWSLVLGFFNFWLFAVPGFLVGAAIGLVIGNVGSKKIKVVCLNCGREHRPSGRQAVNRAAADVQEPLRHGWDDPPIPPDFAEYLEEVGQSDPRYSGRNNALECVLIDMADDKERAVMWAYAVDCARHHRTMGNILHEPDYHKYRAFGEYASRHGDVLRSISDRRAYEYWEPTVGTKAYKAAVEFMR